ncbi:hypothetical protein J6590_027009 [Homalodisca vitripennis]|nr:hypothetical protein J6590_027009 [Homalodisca vitripennis]
MRKSYSCHAKSSRNEVAIPVGGGRVCGVAVLRHAFTERTWPIILYRTYRRIPHRRLSCRLTCLLRLHRPYKDPRTCSVLLMSQHGVLPDPPRHADWFLPRYG